jgi:hypothetical protein
VDFSFSSFLKTLSNERAACRPDRLKAVVAVGVAVVVVVVAAVVVDVERSCAAVDAAAADDVAADDVAAEATELC